MASIMMTTPELTSILVTFQNEIKEDNITPSDSEWIPTLLKQLSGFLSTILPQEGDVLDRTVHDLTQSLGKDLIVAIPVYIQQLIEDWCTGKKLKQAQVREQITNLHKLEWSAIFSVSIQSAVDKVIFNRVDETCRDTFDEALIPSLKDWLTKTLAPCVELMQPQNRTRRSPHTLDLTKSLYLAISKVRADEMFNIIADYPDSLVAVTELREAATATGMLTHVGKVFRSAIVKRLLHPGASTLQIVEMYVLIIRALRVLDSTDLVLTYVAHPIRSYLKSRRDTVRCVVSSLTQGTESDLYGELRRGSLLAYGIDEDDEDGGPGEKWVPRKRNPELTESGARGLDVLALLVSIYGSIDLFASEYRSLLAEKLLQNVQYQTDHEVATLELLKIRFGDDALHSCEVMVRDIEESRRVNTSVHSALRAKSQSTNVPQAAFLPATGASGSSAATVVDLAIVSDNYWPAILSAEDIDIDSSTAVQHPAAQKWLEDYHAAFKILKAPRKLNLLPHLGMVDIDLDFDDGTSRAFSVNPIQASLIMHISERKIAWSSDLASELGLEDSEVKRRMAFWLMNGVIITAPSVADSQLKLRMLAVESTTLSSVYSNQFGDLNKISTSAPEDGAILYEINENQVEFMEKLDGQGDTDQTQMEVDFESSSAVSTAQSKSKLAVVEMYIKGVLTSQKALSLDGLYSMIRMMVAAAEQGGTTSGLNMNIVEFRSYLQSLIDAGILECVDGMYSKQRTGST